MDKKDVTKTNKVLLSLLKSFTNDVCSEFNDESCKSTRRVKILTELEPEIARAVAMDSLLEQLLESMNQEEREREGKRHNMY